MGRVFVADDSPLVRAAVTRRVREAGLEVVEAESVKAAADVDPAGLACALLDLDLGDGWGTDIAERLRASAPDLAIAFFTSEEGGARVDQAKALGPVFAKPGEIDGAIAWVVSRS
jgi:DNA-binding NarL/FixJ family response regulator